jgi:hypothetical protein
VPTDSTLHLLYAQHGGGKKGASRSPKTKLNRFRKKKPNGGKTKGANTTSKKTSTRIKKTPKKKQCLRSPSKRSRKPSARKQRSTDYTQNVDPAVFSNNLPNRKPIGKDKKQDKVPTLSTQQVHNLELWHKNGRNSPLPASITDHGLQHIISTEPYFLPNITREKEIVSEAKAIHTCAMKACAVCDQFVQPINFQMFNPANMDSDLFAPLEAPSDVPNKLRALYDVTSSFPGTEMLQNKLLSPRGVQTLNNESHLRMCKSCHENLKKSRRHQSLNPPKLAIANGFYIGWMPQELLQKCTITDFLLVRQFLFILHN